MQVSELEELSARLHRLRERLETTPAPRSETLAQDHPLVVAAKECEFMLPAQLTIASLAETVERKIANVAVLLERARRHEDLPDSAQAAAGQEYTMTEEDYLLNRPEHGKQGGAYVGREA